MFMNLCLIRNVKRLYDISRRKNIHKKKKNKSNFKFFFLLSWTFYIAANLSFRYINNFGRIDK